MIENVSTSPRVVTMFGEHYFWVRFLLRETGGTSAYIKRVLVASHDYRWDSGEEAYGEVCFVTTPPIFMPAGSTLDLFNSDAGLRVVGDLCAPSVRARVGEPLSLSLQVTFVDAGLREGVAEVSVTVDVK